MYIYIYIYIHVYILRGGSQGTPRPRLPSVIRFRMSDSMISHRIVWHVKPCDEDTTTYTSSCM